MSSSIENEFDPPEWATKEEVIKAAKHYIIYWKAEAIHRTNQWLDEMRKSQELRSEIWELKNYIQLTKDQKNEQSN